MKTYIPILFLIAIALALSVKVCTGAKSGSGTEDLDYYEWITEGGAHCVAVEGLGIQCQIPPVWDDE